MRQIVLSGSLVLTVLGTHALGQAQPGGQDATAPAQTLAQSIPDAPKPQPVLPDVGPITPGKGTTSTSATDMSTGDPGSTLPSTPVVGTGLAATGQDTEIELPNAGEGVKAFTIRGAGATFIQVPFTVKDSKGKMVAGVGPRDVRVYENGVRQPLAIFSADPFPLSVAFVIDQSLPFNTMTTVNNALGAVQGAFAPYDEVAVFVYNNGTKLVTDFTGAQSARLTQAIDKAKGTGREVYLPGGGPLAQTTYINGQNFDPNTAPVRNHTATELNPPKEVHALNDAILAAAVALSKTGPDRRRIIYVISDGKEYGSVAKPKEVIKYLQSNKIAVYGTLVGDSSLPVLGFLDNIHLPLMMRDNVLTIYKTATGGDLDAEFRQGGIERSFAKIAEEVRNQYTTGFYTHEPPIDGKFRKLEVRVLRPNLTVIAKDGYYPSATDVHPHPITPQQ